MLSRTRLREAGHEVVIVGERAGEAVRGKRAQTAATVDSSAEGLYPGDFDALVIPGGYSPDHLRLNPAVVSFVQGFFATGKPVAAICHAAQLLIEAEVVRGKTMTSWPSVRKDLENAGASWVDQEVVEDGNLITSRNHMTWRLFVTPFSTGCAPGRGRVNAKGREYLHHKVARV